MVQINGSSKAMQNGDIVTSYTDTVDPSGTTFTFPIAQETIVLKNKGTKNISYTIGENTGSLSRSESVKLTGSFTSMLLSSELGTQAFEVWSEESGVKSDDPVLEGLATQLAEIATVADFVDVRNYGVKADGTTDDTAAFNSAISAALTKKVPIKLPSGAMRISSTIHITSPNLRFIGTHGQPGYSSGISTTIIYYGTGALFELGLDDGIAWDDRTDYNGVQGTRFEHIRLLAGIQTTPRSSGGNYMAGTTAIKDWRGGSLVLDNIYIDAFDYGFWGIKSDYNMFNNVTINACHSAGLYLGPGSDQNTIIGLNTNSNDRAVWIDKAIHTRFIGCQFVVDGSPTYNPIKISSAWASGGAQGTLFDGCWFERYVGGMIEAFVEVGVGDSVVSNDVTFRDCIVDTGVQGIGGYAKYFVKIGQGRKINIENPINGNLNNLIKLVYCVGSYSPEVFIKAHSDHVNNLYATDGTSTPNVQVYSYGSGQITFLSPTGRFAIRNNPTSSLSDYRFTAEHGSKSFAVDFYNIGDGNMTRFQVDKRLIQGTFSPNSKTWDLGDYVQNVAPSVQGTAGSQYIIRGWTCTVGGTFGTLNGGATTGSITSGTATLTVNSATGLSIGNYITIAGVTGTFTISAISGTNITLSGNANTTVSSAAIAFIAPTFVQDRGLTGS